MLGLALTDKPLVCVCVYRVGLAPAVCCVCVRVSPPLRKHAFAVNAWEAYYTVSGILLLYQLIVQFSLFYVVVNRKVVT